MQIDWITVVAQLINFLVLIWLLKRFLYGPITEAIARREARIAGRLKDAGEAKREAEKEILALFEQRKTIEHQQDGMLEEARRQAKTLRDQLEGEAREEVESLRSAWRRQVDDEREAFLADIRQSTARYVGDLARSVLKEFADADLETQAAKRFAEQLRMLDGKARQDLVVAAEHEQALIESPFALSDATKADLAQAVREVISEDLDVAYGEARDLLLGLRLRIGGRIVAWTLADYFDRLEMRISEALRRNGPSEQRHVA